MQSEALVRHNHNRTRKNQFHVRSTSVPLGKSWHDDIYGSFPIKGNETVSSENSNRLLLVDSASTKLSAQELPSYQKGIFGSCNRESFENPLSTLHFHLWASTISFAREHGANNNTHLLVQHFANALSNASTVSLLGAIRHRATEVLKEDPWESMRRDLSVLQALWADSSQVAPPEQALRDFDAVRTLLDADVRLPDIDVDDETGEITIGWRSAASDAFVCLSIEGNGCVGLLARTEVDFAKLYNLDLGEERNLASKLSEASFIEVMRQ